MKVSSGFCVEGTLVLSVKRGDGVIETLKMKNMVVNWGLVAIAGALAGTAWAFTNVHFALGIDGTGAALGDKALRSEDNSTRMLANVTQLAFPDDNKIQYQMEYAKGAVVGDYLEAGMFNGADQLTSDMFNRRVFNQLSVNIDDTLTVTWLIDVRNA